ncbi:hypothetical protein TrLO_g1176 [Triparma laevis f. longispina]|uniref:Alpha-type protein kinase domain-containing protein n=1 Tax=Triparma laevis f. longispina TaxID=1714387 RepID=A0A9W7L107_9STRA|nr:hypothetical protein TrLO_g1176 [Triparma laevis f. longispina]
MQRIAKVASTQEDPWAKYDMAKLKLEKIKRHQYDPNTEKWSMDESIVRVQTAPFDEGAMRQCYRLKKLSQLPKDATNHSYHSIDWNKAPNYVAKTYKTEDGSVNTSEEGRAACFGDIKLQYEAAKWAHEFNGCNPPKKIHIIRAYAIEFVDREKSPIMTVERFIEGTDEYGVGYVKHNTNSGFVDHDMNRLTPQIFSAYSFYSSEGTRMVVDIQGVGDLYTDPQVHSIDLQFGEADLGIRGFALFFRSFKHANLATALGVPKFELSRNEILLQTTHSSESFEGTITKKGEAAASPPAVEDRKESMAMVQDAARFARMLQANMDKQGGKKEEEKAGGDKVAPLGVTRSKRGSVERRKTKFVKASIGLDEEDGDEDEETESPEFMKRLRSQSTEDYALNSLLFALNPPADPYAYLNDVDTAALDNRHVAHKVLTPGPSTISIIGRVHFEIATLYGSGRFEDDNEDGTIDKESAFYHVCRGAGLGYGPACITLARHFMGLDTDDVCAGLGSVLQGAGGGSTEAQMLLEKAAGCDDEAAVEAISMMLQFFKDTTDLEAKIIYCEKCLGGEGGDGGVCFEVGDKVTAAYGGGDSWYEAEVREVSADGKNIRVFYVEDEEEETLPAAYVKKEGDENLTS